MNNEHGVTCLNDYASLISFKKQDYNFCSQNNDVLFQSIEMKIDKSIII